MKYIKVIKMSSFPIPLDKRTMIQSAGNLDIEYFSDDELNLIFNYFLKRLEMLNQDPKKNAKYIRDLEKYNLLVIVLLETGARIDEALQLRPIDFNLTTGVIRLITLKKRIKNKDKVYYRHIPIHRDLKEAFLTYIAKYHIDIRSEERLFKQSRTAVSEFFKKIEKEIQVQSGIRLRIHAHKFRHTFAVKSILAGIPLNVIQEWLGHSSIFITSIYLKITGRDTRSFMDMIDFMGGIK